MSTDATRDDSEQPAPGDASDPDPRQLVEQLRSAPADELLAELFSTLLSTAQVKLGRRDARLFIDLCAQALAYAGPFLSDELTGQVDSALGQLRLAQVGAESEVARKGEPEPHDLSRVPAPPAPADRGERPGPAPASPASGLWVPGR